MFWETILFSYNVFLIFPEKKFSSLKNKKFQELNFQASKIKETHSGKFLVFQEMELFSLQVETGFLQSLKNKKKYLIFFKLKRKKKKSFLYLPL